MSTETAPWTRRPGEITAPPRATFRRARGADESPSVVEITVGHGRLSVRPAATRPPPRGKGRKGQLYVFLDVVGTARPDLAARWDRRLTEAFFRYPSGSVTSALLRAIQDLNDTILAENEADRRAEPCRAAVACAVVRDGEVFFAVVGPTIAFLDGPDGCDRLGRGAVRPGERPLDPLGATDDVEIQMFHRVIAEPWTIILATSGALTLGGIPEALQADPTAPIAALRQLAASARPSRPFRGIVVSSEGADDIEPDEPDEEDLADGEGDLLFGRGPADPGRRDTSRRRLSDDVPIGRPSVKPGRGPRGSIESRDTDRGLGYEPHPPSPSPPLPRGEARGERAFGWHEVGGGGFADRGFAERRPDLRSAARTRSEDAGGPTRGASARTLAPGPRVDESWPVGPSIPRQSRGRLPDWTETDEDEHGVGDEPFDDEEDLSGVIDVARHVIERIVGGGRPGEDDGPDGHGEPVDDESGALPRRSQRPSHAEVARLLRRGGFWIPDDLPQFARLIVTIVVLFFVGYLIVAVPAHVIQNGAAYARAIGAATQAEGAERAALDANDPTTRRQLLAQASLLAEQARSSQPASATIAATEARIDDEYHAATGAAVLSFTRLVDLPAPGDELVVNGVNLFVLDRTDSRLYRYLMNADGTAVPTVDNPVVVQRGDHLGLVTVGQLSHIAWVPAGDGRSAPALVALDSSGFLVQDAPSGGLSVLGLRDPKDWGGVGSLAATAGDLYAVRPTAGTISAYSPRTSGYDGASRSLLAADAHVDLGDVTALAANGDVYVLRKSGAIVRVSKGEPVPNFPDTTKLFAGPPAGLAATGSALFIGDPKGNRVVQLSPAGQFERYLTAGSDSDVLGRLRDLASADDGAALYALTNDGVYRMDLPAAP